VGRAAVLLLDLQRDFLGGAGARLPVDPDGAAAVLRAANAILAKRMLPAALSVLIVTEFPASARVANYFRKGAAVFGTPGAELDPRVDPVGDVPVFRKSRSSAFTNPDLVRYLQANRVTELYVLGVFAEGCVRATVRDARRRGYPVTVIADAIAADSRWKLRFALWAMRRAGATLVTTEGTTEAA
jgi:nicotinamidase-related amidase